MSIDVPEGIMTTQHAIFLDLLTVPESAEIRVYIIDTVYLRISIENYVVAHNPLVHNAHGMLFQQCSTCGSRNNKSLT